MTGPDEEFEDFLNRRKPVFRRTDDEMFEPPPDLDRVVLRQAREAIKPPEPMRVFSAPRWSMPIALAATLLLAFTIIFRAGMPQKPVPTSEVTAQNVAERVDAPAAAAAPQPQGGVVADVAQPARAGEDAPAAPAEPMVARSMADKRDRAAGASVTSAAAEVASAPAAKASEVPAWRHDPKSWMAEIQRLRDAGETARADAEAAEFKRAQRAYAVAPDR
jgi:hypothetical protein